MLIKMPKVGDYVLHRYAGTKLRIPLEVTEVDESQLTIVGTENGGIDHHQLSMLHHLVEDMPENPKERVKIWVKWRAYQKRHAGKAWDWVYIHGPKDIR
jgi:hypothetical protein